MGLKHNNFCNPVVTAEAPVNSAVLLFVCMPSSNWSDALSSSDVQTRAQGAFLFIMNVAL